MEVSVQQKLLCHLGKGIFRDRCKTVTGAEMQQNSRNMKITKDVTASTDLAATTKPSHLLTFCLKINNIASISRQE